MLGVRTIKPRLFTGLTFLLALSFAFTLLTTTASALGISMDDVHEAVLDNGMRILVLPRGDDPPTASVQVWIGAGAADEAEGKDGLAHFFEHMVFGGTDTLAVGEFDRRIEAVGGRLNAATGQDITFYYTSLPSAHVEEAIVLLGEVTTRPAFPEEMFEREREVIYREIEYRRDSPLREGMEQLFARLHAGHPYARSVLGTRETVAGITREDMFRFIEEQYVPERMTLVVVGDVDPHRIVVAARGAFGHVPARPAPSRPSVPMGDIEDRFPPTQIQDLEQAHLLLGWRAPAQGDDDAPAMTVLAALLDMGRSSRLERHIRRELGLVNGITSGYLDDRDRGTYLVYAQLPPGNERAVEAAILREIERIQQGDFGAEELERARTLLLANRVFALETHEAVARALGQAQTVGGDWRDVFTAEDVIRSVKREDVIRAAQRYLAPDQYVRIVLGPQLLGPEPLGPERADSESLESTEAGVRSSPGGTVEYVSSRSVDSPASVEAMAFGEEPRRERASERDQVVPVEPATTESSGVEVERFVLDNGHVFVLQRRPHAPLVAVETVAAAGRLNEPVGKAGLATLTLRMLLKGTTGLSEEEFLTRVEELGGRINGQAEADFGRLGLLSLPEAFDDLLPLYASALQEPAFDPELFEREREQLRRELRGSFDDTLGRTVEAFREALYGDHPYGTTTDHQLEALEHMTVDDVMAFHRARYAPNHLVTAVVGPIDIEATKALLAETFGGRPAHSGPSPVLPEVGEPQGPVDRELTGARETGWLVVGFPAPAVSDADLAAMDMLETMTGSGFSSLLFKELRDRMAITYSSGAAYSRRLGPGFFVAMAATPPTRDAVEKATEGIFRAFTDGMAAIDNDDISRAREIILGRFAMGREATGAQAALLARYEALGLGYETVQRYPDLIRAVDKQRLQALAADLFRPERSLRAFILPAGGSTQP